MCIKEDYSDPNYFKGGNKWCRIVVPSCDLAYGSCLYSEHFSSSCLQMTEQFKILYKNNVVVEILLVNPPQGQIRKVRSLKAVNVDGIIVSVQSVSLQLYIFCTVE